MNRRSKRRSPDEVFAAAACAGSILASEGYCSIKYRPFQKEGVFAEAGPIYIHESDCRPETEILASYPDEFRELPLLLRAYTQGDGQVDSKLIKDGDAEAIIDTFFNDPQVAYLHLRDGESGCYYARIERAEDA